MNTALAAVTTMALGDFSNEHLDALNLGLEWPGMKFLPGTSLGKQARDARLLKHDGTPQDAETLLAAVSFEINRRLAAGSWYTSPDGDAS